ncbi:condensation domain-containing protein [Acrocarpospora catenulata]|uniref:condensation domain-containing protein n=1 Tax=Acrocarpospora catenulata TaxID=2836182 RepID=UPI001BD94855|nr:condensation domain-containing protein [Acrocarpospora catenulata]
MSAGTARVPFHGARDGEAALTWGQRLMWRAVHLMGDSQTFLNCPWVLAVYGRRDLTTVLAALRVLLERHESLRTTFTATPDGPVQRVTRDGELTVHLVEAGPERGLQVAERLAAEMSRTAFAHGEDLPLRCAVVLKGGRPMALAFCFSHLAVDYQALSLLAEEWRALLKGEDLPPAGWQPMDQAALEREESWQARSGRSIEHWRSVLEEVPLDVFDHAPREPEDPRFIEVGMESVALAAAAERLAERWTVSTTSILIASCATVLAVVSGRPRAVMQLVHSNRRDARTRTMVGTVGQDGLLVLDLPATDFAAACRDAHRAALQAYRNAHYDPFAMQSMREEIGRRRGREPDLDAFFNDRRGIGDWPSLPRFAPGQDLSVLTGKTRTYVTNAWPGVRFKAFFTVGTATDTGQLSLIIDTAYLTRDTATTLLLAIETILVRSLTEEVPMAEIPRLCLQPS